MNKILIVDDDISVCESLKFAFKGKYEMYFAYEPSKAIEHFMKEDIEVILLDLKLGKWDGMDLYRDIRKIDENIPVIIITAYGTIKSSVEAIKQGVFHYVTKPMDLSELEFMIEKGIELNNLYKQIDSLNEELRKKNEMEGIVAKSKSMERVMEIVNKVKDIDANVLITGESGTGKEVIARAIHFQGNRKEHSFVPINCSAIPSNLLESELFGYEKGAFTGADKKKKGLFEVADKGTLFLDEIGDMDIHLQSKLLRAIQEKNITPLGSNTPRKIDVRIIAATNMDLEKAIDETKFREDLFYRLNVINIKLPPLRERKEDIPYLVRLFVNKYSQEFEKSIKGVSPEFLDYLYHYDFKGNIRELENIIERAVALSDKEVLTEHDLPKDIPLENRNSLHDSNLIPVYIGESLKQIEKKVILQTYEFCGQCQKETAEILGVSDRTIRNKLKEYKNE